MLHDGHSEEPARITSEESQIYPNLSGGQAGPFACAETLG